MQGPASRAAGLLAITAIATACAQRGDRPAAVRAADADRAAEREQIAAELERGVDAYAGVGRRDLAAPLYARAIENRAADAPLPRPRALAALAVIQHDRGRAAEALHFYQRALDALDDGDPELRALVHFHRGSLLRASGQPEPALADLERALALRGGDRADASPQLAALLGETGAAYAALGRTEEALQRYRQALAVWELHLPASEPVVAETLANLGLLHTARGEREQPRALFARALALYQNHLAADDATVLRVRELIASSERPPARERAPAPDPAALARALDHDGAALLERREYARARPLLERAVAIHERGATAPLELGASLSSLGRAYAGLGEREAALRALARALALLEPARGPLDPLVLATRASLENLRASAPANAEP